MFSYHHLLTPIETTFNSSNNSLCSVLQGQHKLRRTVNHCQSTAVLLPFYNLYVENFSAAKELGSIDEETDKTNGDGSLFSLEYNSVPRCSRPLLQHEPIPIKNDLGRMAQQMNPIVVVTPVALNEHKYTMKSNFYTKHPNPSTPTQSRNEFTFSPPVCPESQNMRPNSMLTRQSYDHSRNEPVASGTVIGQFKNFYERNTPNEWIELSQWSQIESSSRGSSNRYGSSSGHGNLSNRKNPIHGNGTSSYLREFYPTQSKFNQ